MEVHVGTQVTGDLMVCGGYLLDSSSGILRFLIFVDEEMIVMSEVFGRGFACPSWTSL